MLAELQREFSRGLLCGEVPALAFAGRVSPREAMRVHRNTVIGALVGALRISYPSVDALVGEEFFDAVGAAFAESNPPVRARLNEYGEGFGAFVQSHCPLPYIGDVARLDWAIERAGQKPTASREFALDGQVSMALPQSLAVLGLNYAADLIRGALGDDAALAAIDLQPGTRFVALWRDGAEVRVRALGPAAGIFLREMLESLSAARGFAAALAEGGDTIIHDIQAEVFSAPFCKIISRGTP